MNAINAAFMAAGLRLEVPWWPINDHPPIRAMNDAEAGSLPSDPRQWFSRLTVPDSSCWPPPFSARRKAHRELVELIERARDLVVKAELGPDEVRAMLAEARAPIPAAADDLAQLAAECLRLTLDVIYEQGLNQQFDWELRKKGWRDANAAVETLRRLLPLIIGELEHLGVVRRVPPIRRVLQQLNQIDLTMLNLGPARRPWAEGAVSLAKAYVETVDRATGWAREGPAVRFLALALSRAYQQEISAAAIATELGRHRDKIFSS
jgi:hypothetical protein